MGRPRATAGHVLAPAGRALHPRRARREVVLDEGGRRRGDGRDATAVPSPPRAVSARRPPASADDQQQQQRKRDRADHRQSPPASGPRRSRTAPPPRSGCRRRPTPPRPVGPGARTRAALRAGGGAIPWVVRSARARAARHLPAPRGRLHLDPPRVGPHGEAALGRDPHAPATGSSSARSSR